MPNRILRDWTDSYRFDGLSCEAGCLLFELPTVTHIAAFDFEEEQE
jgi:hypothetical protein